MKKILISLAILAIQQNYTCASEQESAKKIPQAVLTEIKSVNFANHLSHHFGKENLVNFIHQAHAQTPEAIEKTAQDFDLAGNRFHRSQSFSSVSPEGKSIEQYLEDLKNSND